QKKEDHHPRAHTPLVRDPRRNSHEERRRLACRLVAIVCAKLARLLVPERSMSSSLFRRLIVAALALVAVTLLALNYVLTTFAVRIGAPVDPSLRTSVLAIALLAALLALGTGLSVSRALTSRVRRLKRAAEGLLDAEAQPGVLSDPNDALGSLERSLTGVG